MLAPAAPPLVRAWIGLGANLGDARQALRSAFAELAALPGSRWVARSSLYRSAPVDAPGADYLNAVALIETSLDAQHLLHALQAIEARHGRRRPQRNAPRTLDLDLLLYGDATLATPALTVPHPRLHLRAFVLVPMAEIAARLGEAAAVPGHGLVAALLAGVTGQRVDRLDE